MHIFEREVTGRRYRIAAQSIWDAASKRSVARQIVLGPVEAPQAVDLGATRTVGTLAVGDVGALAWVAEELDLVALIDRTCGVEGAKVGPSLGEMVVAVAIQRGCLPGPKRDLARFLDGCLPRVSCLPGSKFTGQAFHRLASQVTDEALEAVQVAIAREVVRRFDLSANVLAFDTTNFDTNIATPTSGELARRGHAKSKRGDLRVVGLGVLASETGHVPLLYRTYAGNASDQSVLRACLDGLGKLHDALDEGESRRTRAGRTIVRDGGFWSPQLELELDVTDYYSLISLPLGHGAAQAALNLAAKRGAMKHLKGAYREIRASRFRSPVAELDRTLVVIESPELLAGQKRGIAAALKKARRELRALERRVVAGRVRRSRVDAVVTKVLAREHLATFVVTRVGGDEERPTFRWHVDKTKRRELERTRLGRRVLCTDRHTWSTERIVAAFRGQWNVEELFRRAKRGGVVPWAPSHQWADGSLRLHTFATFLGLTLVSLAKLALKTGLSARRMMATLRGIRATQVRTSTGTRGRRPTALLAPDLTPIQARAVRVFNLARWMPALSSCRPSRNANLDADGAG